MHRRALIGLLAPFLLVGSFAAETAPPARLVVSLLMQGSMTELEPLLRSRLGGPLTIEYTPMMKLVERLDGAEAVDVTIISKAAADRLTEKGLVRSQVELAQSEVGIAVADDAPAPILKTEADLVAFLRATPSIAYFVGGSGTTLIQFAERHGIGELVKRKGTVVSDGFTSPLIRQGKVASAVQAVSELRYGGANNIVLLPESLQNRTATCLVVLQKGKRSDLAAKIVQVLTSQEAAGVYRRAGLLPVFVK
jgi:hypothetical protein